MYGITKGVRFTMSENRNVITTGSGSIDELLGGGLGRGTTCLIEELIGESSGYPGLVGMTFLLEGIRRGDGGILLLSEHTVDEYLQLPGTRMLRESAKPHQFVFMDALSSMTYGEPAPPLREEEGDVVRCSNVRYAPKFYEELRTTVSSLERPLMYVDSLSVLLHAMESDRAAWQFWLSLLPLIRRRELTIVASYYPEMHSHEFNESIERICDTIIRFTALTSEATKARIHYIQVLKNRGLSFDDEVYPYGLKGFEFLIDKHAAESRKKGGKPLTLERSSPADVHRG
jgi:KaiC/GvpD/RAD55 family RecA-like ATPase